MKRISAVIILGSFAALAGCTAAEQGTEAKGLGGHGPAPKSEYDLANGCFALKPETLAKFTVATEAGYAAAGTAAEAARFFLKPTGLGSYMLYAADGALMSVAAGATPLDAGTVAPGAEPGPAADWTVAPAAKGRYTLTSLANGKALALGENDALVLADAPANFEFLRAGACKAFPEMPTGIAGKAFKGETGAPVI